MTSGSKAGRRRERGFYLLDRSPADLVEFVVAAVQASLTEGQHARALDPRFHAEMDRLADRLRAWLAREAGPGQHYIAARPLQRKKAAIASGLQRGDPLEAVFAAAGVSRSHGYRILGMGDRAAE